MKEGDVTAKGRWVLYQQDLTTGSTFVVQGETTCLLIGKTKEIIKPPEVEEPPKEEEPPQEEKENAQALLGGVVTHVSDAVAAAKADFTAETPVGWAVEDSGEGANEGPDRGDLLTPRTPCTGVPSLDTDNGNIQVRLAEALEKQ